jgi:hypothetical protein
MIIEKCPICDETAIKLCPVCNNQSFCPSCNDCVTFCAPKKMTLQDFKPKQKAVHLTIRIGLSLHTKINEILEKELRKNHFVKKSDIVRELLSDGIRARRL